MYILEYYNKENKLVNNVDIEDLEKAKEYLNSLKENYNPDYSYAELVDEDTSEVLGRWDNILTESKSEEIADFIEDLYDMRKESVKNEGEYSEGNLIFKEFRNKGYLHNLKDLRKKELSKELSLEHLNENEKELNYDDSYIGKYRKYANLEEDIEITEDNLDTWALNKVSCECNYDVHDLKELLLKK